NGDRRLAVPDVALVEVEKANDEILIHCLATREINTFQITSGMDSQQQFCLKWNSFGSNLATAFGNLFKSESLADVTLFCEGVTFRAHKLILAACSKHFQDLFEMAPLNPTVLVIMDGTSSSNMSALLEFMYKGEVHVSQECLSSFLKAAECLQVKGLSIEHEKLAVVHGSKHIGQVGEDISLDSPTGRKPKLGDGSQSSSSEQQPPPPQPMHPQHHAPTSSASASYASILSPYPLHYRPYEQRVPASAPPATASGSQSQMYDNFPRKRHHRSSSEAPPPDAVRASVLRDGSKSREAVERASMPLGYRPGGLSPASEPDGKGEEKGYQHVRYEGGPGPGSSVESRDARDREGPGGSSVGNPGSAGTVPFDRTAAVDVESGSQAKPESRRSSVDPGSNCPEDLRVKLEFTSGSHSEEQHGNAAPYAEPAVETAAPESLPANVWNSGTSIKMSPHKGGPVATTDAIDSQTGVHDPLCSRAKGSLGENLSYLQMLFLPYPRNKTICF
ncbi:Zinc finger protein chinmo, partial [Gryllus bimaculatus]